MLNDTIVIRINTRDYVMLKKAFPAFEGESMASYFNRVRREVEKWKLKIETES